ncbi:hypothetical protein D3C87_2107210 [compost metagenome]
MQCRDNAAEIHRLQGVIQFQFFGDSGPQVDIEADIFVALLKLKRNECGVGGDDQFVCCVGAYGKGQRKCGQGDFKN